MFFTWKFPSSSLYIKSSTKSSHLILFSFCILHFRQELNSMTIDLKYKTNVLLLYYREMTTSSSSSLYIKSSTKSSHLILLSFCILHFRQELNCITIDLLYKIYHVTGVSDCTRLTHSVGELSASSLKQ